MPAKFRGAVLNCQVCGVEFRVSPSRIGKAKTCSIECAGPLRGEAQKKRVTIGCAGCGKEFEVPNCHADRRSFCSKECQHGSPEGFARKSARSSGEGNSMWKGGVVKHSDGYVYLFVGRDHPFAWQGYVLGHRVVMERHLRETDPASPFLVRIGDQLYLSPDFDVHHDDEDKVNNDIGNLLCMTPSEHRKLHNARRRARRNAIQQAGSSASCLTSPQKE